MTTLEKTAFKQLESEKRLFNPVFKNATGKPGRFGFRGEIAIKLAQKLSDEARPPEITADQVIAVAQEGGAGLDFMAAYLLSFEYLKPLADALGSTLKSDGKYFLYCNNIDLSKRYQVPYDGKTFYVLPIDEATDADLRMKYWIAYVPLVLRLQKITWQAGSAVASHDAGSAASGAVQSNTCG